MGPDDQLPTGVLPHRRDVLLQGGAAIMAVAAPQSVSATLADTRARRPMIIDTLGGLGNPNHSAAATAEDFASIDARATADGHASGLCAFNQTLGYVSGTAEPFEYSVASIGRWDDWLRQYPGTFIKVRGAADIREAYRSRRFGVIYGFQNGAMFGSDPTRVATFASLGLRITQLTYNIRNQLGDGAMAPQNGGLTELGRAMLAEIQRHNIILDLSHSGEQTCLDAIAASTGPLVISHTGCRAIADLPRNKADRELRGVAEKGGFVGIYFMPFLAIGRQPTAEDLVAHIEHAIQVCGEDHVAIGTDGVLSAVDDMPAYFTRLRVEVDQRRAAGISATGERADIVPFLPDLQGADKFWRLADLLQSRGHSPARIDKLLGLNFLRCAESIWGV